MKYKNGLKEFRISQNLIQVDFADKINYTLSMYEKVENGRVNASSQFMKAVKKAFPFANIDSIFFNDNSDKNAVV